MSSKVFRMWPTLALALLVAAVWHWGVPAEPAAAQTVPASTPASRLSVNWQWTGGTVRLSASGLTPDTRAFAYVLWSADSAPSCRDMSVVANQVGDDLVDSDGDVAFTLMVEPPRFQAGDHNYLCVIDGLQRGIDLAPLRLRVVERPPYYRMRLDVTSIVQAPDDDYVGGAMPRHFAVVDGRHWDNWRLPQRRTFGIAGRLGHMSNLGQTATADPVLFPGVGGGVEVANSFTTGGVASDRFVISSVVVDFGANAHNARVGIYSNDVAAGGQPGVRIGSDLHWSGVSKSGEVTFARGDLFLAGDTTYWLVFKSNVAQGSEEPIVRTVDNGSEDDGGLASWSIGDSYKYRNGSTGDWSTFDGSSRVLRFRVNVAEATPKGVDVMPTALSVSEGSSSTYRVRLNAPPASAVTVTVSKGGGGDTDLTVDTDPNTADDQNTLTFTTDNWETWQNVRVKAAQDDTDSSHGEATFTHRATSSDPGYNITDIASVTATEADDDDGAAPTCASATVVGDELTITCDEAMKINSRPAESAFAVTVDGVKRDVSGYTISGSVVILDLVRPVAPAQTVMVAYIKPDVGDVLEDWAGHALPSFTEPIEATNDSDYTPPTVSSATVNENTLVVAFNEELAAAGGLDNGAFVVKKTTETGEITVGLSGSPVINGRTVTLTLASPVVSTDTDVEVSYTKPDTGSNNKLKDVANNEVGNFSQAVKIGRLHDGPLVSTYGQWHRCQDRLVGGSGIRLGCSWEEPPAGGGSQDEVYLEPVERTAAPVQVPGDTMQLRIFLNDADLGVRKAAERYVVFWGPVDLWLLGAGSGIEPQDFVIQGEHLAGIRSRTVVQDDLVNGAFTLDLERSSANYRGDTFVALVPCNDDYLEGKFGGDEFNRAQRAFGDCTERSAAGLPPLNEGDSDSTPKGVQEAWSQHDPLSGLGLSCSVTLSGEGSRTIRCRNDLVKSVTWDEYKHCMDLLSSITEGGSIKCGMGHQRKPYGASATTNWGSTRYNAAMAFYGFVIDWQRGYSGGQGRPGCDVNLLPYRIVEDRYVGFPDLGTGKWLTGEVGGASDEDCIADPDEDEVTVGFYTPESDESWSDAQKDWHDTHPVHFAVYVSGMASEYAGAVDVGGVADWRRVPLGTWDVDESVPYGRVRGLTRLGLWYPHSGAGVSEVSGVRLPSMESMNGGKGLTVPRDFAGLDGVVRLYVVPCLPTYSERGITLGVCEDLPARTGPVSPVLFGLEARQVGPFGFDRNTSIIAYSIGVTVIFRSGPDGEGVSRSVSHPPTVREPAGHVCGLVSVAPDGGSSYWPEVTVQGGACDRNDLNVVPVTISNAGGAGDDRLVVYATGGRTEGLDKVRMRRAGVDAGDREFGRLGLREREFVLTGSGSETLHVSADLANRSGEVWLVAYSCGGTSRSARCPSVNRDRVPVVYDIAVPSAFVIVVKFTAAAGLRHTELAPVCQGADCDIEVGKDVPVLREAVPDAPDGTCGASSYPSAPSGGLIYWPDRLVSGGACAPDGLEDVEVAFHNATGVGGQRLVVYATGGRGPGLERVQVNRAGEPAGRAGLRRVEFTLGAGETSRVLVSPDLADDDGRVLLLAYHCSEGSGGCPAVTSETDAVTYAVDRRPLFQVLVQYDDELLSPSGLAICRGDSCSEIYELERFERPPGQDCSASASYSGGELYWPDRVVAGGACDRRDLDDVTVTFSAPSSSSEERLLVYVTGGRSPGLETVNVRREEPGTPGVAVGRFDVSIPFPEDVDVNGSGVRANLAAVTGVLDGKDWVQDGLTAVENRILDAMRQLAGRYEGAERVAGMSFLDHVDDTDYITVMALVKAAEKGVADDIVEHSVFDGDIDDDERLLVIGASQYSDGGVAAVTGRLDEGEYDVEMEESSTADTPSLVVWVARDQKSVGAVPNAADLVKASVESMEEMMGRPFPISHVVMFLDSGMFARGSSSHGFNYGGVVFAVRPDLEHPARTIIHEVAHYYWYGARIWIDEGMADTAIAVFGARPSLDVPMDRLERSEEECPHYDNLSELDPVADDLPRVDELCPYYLGQQLFLDLRETLGVADFRAGVRRLYDTILAKEAQGVRWGYWANVDDLREAFSGNEVAQEVIDRHWFPAISGSVVSDSPFLGRLGLRQETLTIPADGAATVSVSPDLARLDGHVWLLAYRCDSSYGDSGCPVLGTPVRNGYDLPKGPDFAVRVKYTKESGLTPADLQEVCRGQQCDIAHPWLRRAEPSVDECSVQLGAHWDFWPDRVVRGGGCHFRGLHYGSVDFRAEGAEKFVVYTTGGVKPGLDLVRVYGVLGTDDNTDGEQLGRSGLRETRVDLAPGGEEQVWVRSDMADDDGNVWLFVYRCLTAYGDAGCPLVGRDAIRPSYDVPIRPAFVVRVGFLEAADASRSSLTVDCPRGAGTCQLTATFRTADGETLPGTVEFRVDNGALGATGSTAQTSTKRNDGGHQFKETLILPPAGSVVNIEAELLGDGVILLGQAGVAGTLDRLSVRVMRCSGEVASCHTEAAEEAEGLLPGEWFVLRASGHDSAGNTVFSTGSVAQAICAAGPSGPWPTFRLRSNHLKSYSYGAPQPDDRGHVGCAIRVADDAPVGRHNIAVSYGAMTVPTQVAVIVDRSKLGFIGLTGPSRLESGEEGEYTAIGYTMDGIPAAFDGGCLKLRVTGPLESNDGGSSDDQCLTEGLSLSGEKFTVTASDDLLYNTDASVGVEYGGRKRVMHVLVVPAEDEAAPSPVAPSSSHITDLTITPEGSQLRVSWTASPTADFESLRAQVWLVIGGEDVFLPGCMGGEPHDVSTYEVFCLLSYGQSGDVYHAAVGFLRHDGTAVPVETAQWVRP